MKGLLVCALLLSLVGSLKAFVIKNDQRNSFLFVIGNRAIAVAPNGHSEITISKNGQIPVFMAEKTSKYYHHGKRKNEGSKSYMYLGILENINLGVNEVLRTSDIEASFTTKKFHVANM